MGKKFFQRVLGLNCERDKHRRAITHRHLRYEALNARLLLTADLAVADTPDSAEEVATVDYAEVQDSVVTETQQPKACELNNPFFNPVNRHDVNDDGLVTAADVDAVMASLNRGEGGPLPSDVAEGESPRLYLDVSGDRFLSPIDALHVINYLNSQEALPQPDNGLPFTNPDNPLDVDGSGSVNADDVAAILADIAARGARELDSSQTPPSEPPFLDVNGDGHVAPSDALQVVDFLNNEARQAATTPTPQVHSKWLEDLLELSELEPLLDALAADVSGLGNWSA